jgi:hypothetical protein
MRCKQRHGLGYHLKRPNNFNPSASCCDYCYGPRPPFSPPYSQNKHFFHQQGKWYTSVAMNFFHQILDYCLSSVKLIKNQEVGWRIINRKTGKQGREQQPILKKIKLLFLFSRFVEWVDVTQVMRLWIHDKTIQEGMSRKYNN